MLLSSRRLLAKGVQADNHQDYTLPPSPFFEDIQIVTDDRIFFLTRNGSMGLGPVSTRKGDTIHILPSGSAHFVLRSKPAGLPQDGNCSEWLKDLSTDHFELIGDCYLHANGAPENRRPAEEEPAVEGSLPFELLGERYLRERGLPIRDHIFLV